MLDLIEAVDDCRLYQWKSVLLAIHWRGYQLMHIDLLKHVSARICGEQQRISSIVVIRGNFSFSFDHRLRTATAELAAQTAGMAVAQALVVEEDGFKASIVRSIATATNLLAKTRMHQRVFKDGTEGTRWVCDQHGQPSEIKTAGVVLSRAVGQLLRELPVEAQSSQSVR